MKIAKKTIISAALGTCLEWFDFTVFIYIAPILSKLFFPHDNHLVSLIATFGIFAAGYIMRPIGGIFFGNLGDKIGRKKVLIITVLCMSIPMLITAVLPTYQQIGITAVAILILARLIQGFSVGGEYTGVLVMLVEQSERKHRGFITAWGTFVSGSGVLLSSLTVTLITHLLSNQQMLHWGWRIPFFIGFLLAAFTLVMQTTMQESPEFIKLKEHKQIEKRPVVQAIKNYPGRIMMVLALTGYLGIAYYLVAAFLPSYLMSVLKINHTLALTITSIAAAVYAFSAPVWGALSDRIGRRPVMITSTIGLAVLTYPLFLLLIQGTFWSMLTSEVILIALISACTAAFVTTINELFPTRERFSGVGTGYNVGNAIFGGTTPLVATYLIHATGLKLAPCFYLIIASVLILWVMWKMPETKDASL